MTDITMILNKRKRHQALIRIICITIIAIGEIKDEKILEQTIGYLSDLAFYVGGIKGMKYVSEEVFPRIEPNENTKES